MITFNNRQPKINQRAQSGIALYVSLIILVMLTVVGIAVLNNNNVQLKMGYRAADSITGFQSAESALVAAEDWISVQTNRPIAGCSDPCGDSTTIWRRVGEAAPVVNVNNVGDEAWWQRNGRKLGFSYIDGAVPSAVSSQGIENNNATARYVIEDLGAADESVVMNEALKYKVYFYQITARGYGAQSDSRTMVKSVFSKGY